MQKLIRDIICFAASASFIYILQQIITEMAVSGVITIFTEGGRSIEASLTMMLASFVYSLSLLFADIFASPCQVCSFQSARFYAR